MKSLQYGTVDVSPESVESEAEMSGIFKATFIRALAADRDRLASENARLSAALELAREERDDKVDGLESDLSSALDVLWRRGDDEARTWIKRNYPKFPAVVKIAGSM